MALPSAGWVWCLGEPGAVGVPQGAPPAWAGRAAGGAAASRGPATPAVRRSRAASPSASSSPFRPFPPSSPLAATHWPASSSPPCSPPWTASQPWPAPGQSQSQALVGREPLSASERRTLADLVAVARAAHPNPPRRLLRALAVTMLPNRDPARIARLAAASTLGPRRMLHLPSVPILPPCLSTRTPPLPHSTRARAPAPPLPLPSHWLRHRPSASRKHQQQQQSQASRPQSLQTKSPAYLSPTRSSEVQKSPMKPQAQPSSQDPAQRSEQGILRSQSRQRCRPRSRRMRLRPRPRARARTLPSRALRGQRQAYWILPPALQPGTAAPPTAERKTLPPLTQQKPVAIKPTPSTTQRAKFKSSGPSISTKEGDPAKVTETLKASAETNTNEGSDIVRATNPNAQPQAEPATRAVNTSLGLTQGQEQHGDMTTKGKLDAVLDKQKVQQACSDIPPDLDLLAQVPLPTEDPTDKDWKPTVKTGTGPRRRYDLRNKGRKKEPQTTTFTSQVPSQVPASSPSLPALSSPPSFQATSLPPPRTFNAPHTADVTGSNPNERPGGVADPITDGTMSPQAPAAPITMDAAPTVSTDPHDLTEGDWIDEPSHQEQDVEQDFDSILPSQPAPGGDTTWLQITAELAQRFLSIPDALDRLGDMVTLAYWPLQDPFEAVTRLETIAALLQPPAEDAHVLPAEAATDSSSGCLLADCSASAQHAPRRGFERTPQVPNPRTVPEIVPTSPCSISHDGPKRPRDAPELHLCTPHSNVTKDPSPLPLPTKVSQKVRVPTRKRARTSLSSSSDASSKPEKLEKRLVPIRRRQQPGSEPQSTTTVASPNVTVAHQPVSHSSVVRESDPSLDDETLVAPVSSDDPLAPSPPTWANPPSNHVGDHPVGHPGLGPRDSPRLEVEPSSDDPLAQGFNSGEVSWPESSAHPYQDMSLMFRDVPPNPGVDVDGVVMPSGPSVGTRDIWLSSP